MQSAGAQVPEHGMGQAGGSTSCPAGCQTRAGRDPQGRGGPAGGRWPRPSLGPAGVERGSVQLCDEERGLLRSSGHAAGAPHREEQAKSPNPRSFLMQPLLGAPKTTKPTSRSYRTAPSILSLGCREGFISEELMALTPSWAWAGQ